MQGNGRNPRPAREPGLSRPDGGHTAAPEVPAIFNMEAGLEVLPEIAQRILAQRAAQLARVTEEQETGAQINLVLAHLGRDIFGLEAQYVAEMRPLEQLTRVPRTPNWVRGVVNWRGHILSVLDLQTYWELPRDGDTSAAYLIICETPEMTVALAVDSVASVEAIPVSAIEETSTTVRGLPPEVVRGVATHATATAPLLTVLNLTAVLADPHLIVHEEIM